MSLWNTIKGWFSTSVSDEQAEAITYATATLATPVEVEEVPDSEECAPAAPVAREDAAAVAQMFTNVCLNAGVKQRYLDSTNAVTLFQEWYTGQASEEEIKEAIAEFKRLNPPVNAKFQGII